MRIGGQFGLCPEPRSHVSAPVDSVATEETRGGLCINSFLKGSSGQTLAVSRSFRTQTPVGTAGGEKGAVERSKLCVWDIGGFTRLTRGWDALPPLQTVGRVNRTDEATAPPQLLSALHTCAHMHTTSPHPPGGPGHSCLPGLNLAPQRSHSAHQGTHLPFPASDNIGQGEENGRTRRGKWGARVSPGSPQPAQQSREAG